MPRKPKAPAAPKSKVDKFTSVKSLIEVVMPNGKTTTLLPGVKYSNLPDSVKKQL